MKKLIIAVLLLSFVILCACNETTPPNTPDPDNSGSQQNPPDDNPGNNTDTPTPPENPDGDPPAPPEQDPGLKWSDYVFHGSYKDEALAGDLSLVNLTVTLPKVEGNADIQIYYDTIVTRMKESAQTTYLDMGKQYYKLAQDGIGVFTPITVEIGYNVLFNDGTLFSVRREKYENTGGAHPGITVESEVFRVSDGAKMLFSDIFTIPRENVFEELRPIIEQEMDSRIALYGAAYYNDNAKAELFNLWSNGDFYLTEEHLVMYWQTYSLGPYVSGLQEFMIPLADIADIMKTEF